MAWLLIALAALVTVGRLGNLAGQKVENVIEKSDNRKKFRAEFLDAAATVNWQGIPPLFALAVADTETAQGTGSVYLKTRNLFSLTVGSGWKVAGGWNGQTYKAASGLVFRCYDTLAGSMKEFVHLLYFPLYSKALTAALKNDVRTFAAELKNAGYDASEPKYAQIVVDRYNSIQEDVA